MKVPQQDMTLCVWFFVRSNEKLINVAIVSCEQYICMSFLETVMYLYFGVSGSRKRNLTY